MFTKGTQFIAAGVDGIHEVTEVKDGIVFYTAPYGPPSSNGVTVLEQMVEHNIIQIVPQDVERYVIIDLQDFLDAEVWDVTPHIVQHFKDEKEAREQVNRFNARRVEGQKNYKLFKLTEVEA